VDRAWSPPSSVGAYEILGLIGRGGMAEVYAVRHREQERHYALKIASLPHPRLVERFEREVELQARLVHPHVLSVLERLDVHGRPAVLLPLVQGPTLERLLAEGQLATEHALALFRQIVAGVAAIHAAGLVHRDLKPGNVLLELASGGVVAKVSDFGLAKALQGQRLTQTGILLGTPAYAAPEQRRDAAHVDARADVFALGCILAELLTGVPPAEGTDTTEHVPVDPGWRALARRLRSKRPAQRPADASVVARMLPAGGAKLDDPGLLARCRALAPALPTPAQHTPAQHTLVPPVDAAPSHALPAERDPFVGRRADLEALERQVAEGTRLLTVLGMGGTGKTRLVTHYAWERRDRWPGGCWFCDLSEARSEAGIAYAVARALQLPLAAGDGVAQLGHALAGRGRCLVLLDNFEQVAEHAAPTLGRWLDRAPEAQFVVTSRETLGLPGETVLVLEPLAPEEGAELFVRRARAARIDFEPSGADQEAIGALVRLLDGLPLAIELAAARVRMMSPEMLLARMDERFRLLVSQGGRADRQATLKATLDWSWSLLSEPEREALAQLSVFEGGFVLPDAERVLEVEGAWAADLLQSLLDKSLVQRLPGQRLGLLVSVQQYAAAQLRQRGGTAGAELRHGRTFAARGERQQLERLDQQGGAARRAVLGAELDNLRAACKRAIARGDALVAAATARACWELYQRLGPLSAGAELLEAALTVPALERADALFLRWQAGVAALLAGPWQTARAHAEAAVALADSPQDERYGLSLLGRVHAQQGRRQQARQHFEAALARAREAGDRRQQGVLLNNLGCLTWREGDPARARPQFEAALALTREIGCLADEAVYVTNLGVMLGEMEQLEEAHACYERALAAHREVGDPEREAAVLTNLGELARTRGDLPTARARFEEARDRARALGDPGNEGFAMGGLANVHALLGELELARQQLEGGIRLLKISGDMHELILFVCLRARWAQQQGWPEAREAVGEARALAGQLSLGPDTDVIREIEDIEHRLS
jgi:predicted ATPase/Tfp pilus assembly protein PilF